MSTDRDLEQEKAWRRRNSDFRDTFEGERTYLPPTFDLTDHDLPPTPHGPLPTDDPDPELFAHAIRHTHVFDPALIDPEA